MQGQNHNEDLSGLEFLEDEDVGIEQSLGSVLVSDLVNDVYLPEKVVGRKTINQHRINNKF